MSHRNAEKEGSHLPRRHGARLRGRGLSTRGLFNARFVLERPHRAALASPVR